VSGSQDDAPILITGAQPSADDQHSARKRKYLIMMGLRIPCLILAGLYYQTWWLALAFVAISIPLPWIAVLIANDRPPRKSEQVNRYHVERAVKELEDRDHPVIDG
jgi:hypothetical protein